MIVVDASMTLAWCLGDERDETAERTLERVVAEGAVALAHWPLEVDNRLWAAGRRCRVDPADGDRPGRLLFGRPGQRLVTVHDPAAPARRPGMVKAGA